MSDAGTRRTGNEAHPAAAPSAQAGGTSSVNATSTPDNATDDAMEAEESSGDDTGIASRLRSARVPLGIGAEADRGTDTFVDADEGGDEDDDDDQDPYEDAPHLMLNTDYEYGGGDEDEDFYAAEDGIEDEVDDEDIDEDDDDVFVDEDDADVQEYISRLTAGQSNGDDDGDDDEDDDGEEDDQDDDMEAAAEEGNVVPGQLMATVEINGTQQEMGLLELLAALTQSRGAGGLSAMAVRTLRQIAAGQVQVGRRTAVLNNNGDDDEDEDDDDDEDEDYYDEEDEGELTGYLNRGARQHQPRPKMGDRWDKVTDPVPAGVELLMSGDFGRPPSRPTDAPRSNFASSRNLYGILGAHKTSTRPLARSKFSHYVPNSAGVEVARYDDRCYCGQYSEDSTFFYSCTKNFMLHMYDTTRAQPPPPAGHGLAQRYRANGSQLTSLRTIKSIKCRGGDWTITDANLSPDNRFMIYSSISPYIHLVPTGLGDVEEGSASNADDNADDDSVDPNNPAHSARQVQLDLSPPSARNSWFSGGAIWSIRFSGDAREIVAGAGSGDIAVYDIEARRQTLRVPGHSDDVNAVAFADRGSGNVLISGSDDTYVKVWDRRSLYQGKPAGVLVGHTEGVTFVAPKGDGRYCVSNGKDQSAKLWDLRQMHSGADFDRMLRVDRGSRAVYGTGYDYRGDSYGPPAYETRPNDCSLMTFRGHAVLRTLIRCHFSPEATTGQKYIYSGSADGLIHIWSLDGRVVQVIDRSKTLPLVSDVVKGAGAPSEPDFELNVDANDSASNSGLAYDGFEGRYRPVGNGFQGGSSCVRDVSWHSAEPSMMSTAWGANGRGSIAKHEWKDFGKQGLSLEDALEKARLEALR
ncbi:hypothetical protein CF327_g6328 [Tilletia walkeri]|nr:hypothetical protein CF327_g6328 [Tilletia walkeri]